MTRETPGNRVFSSRPSQRDHPYALDLRLTGRLKGGAPAELQEWTWGGFPKGCQGKVLYRIVADPLVTVRVAAGEQGQPARPKLTGGALPTGLVRVELCRPEGASVQGTLVEASALLMGRRLQAEPTASEAFRVGEACEEAPAAKEARLRSALREAWGPGEGFEEFLSSSRCELERSLSGRLADCPAAGETRRLFARASYAFALSLANDCRGVLDDADGSRGSDVLDALVRGYRGERLPRVRPGSAH